jgi:hypothetical protein
MIEMFFFIYAVAGLLWDVYVDVKDTDPPVWGLHRSSEVMVAHLVPPMNLGGAIGLMAIR